ncbi:MAG: bifunctional 4-hydroxy-2-oxoglutarate aldolase/2-dehydro-3-deoxy-phosphogluconate aldolase [Chitinophagaceae bacterium]|nr:MAG: bifunctional 4-hydroxy-2-oxoglutarate aldolase/2-dehydro-3-deoxy-phosphogluconate aldolase [Chitinophagaceae bacterium]
MNSFSWESFRSMPVVGIVRNLPADSIEDIAERYAASGLTTIEITLNTPGAADMISKLAKKFGTRLNVGAGTVCSVDDLDLALNAGASFIVTPVINEDVIRKCVENHVTIFPGAYTPSEIYKAWSMGAPMIKLFPATRLGVDYIKEVLAPLNKVKLLPTGGVSLENCETFFKAGAAGVGMGSNLFPKQLIESKSWDDLSVVFKRYADVIGAIQN